MIKLSDRAFARPRSFGLEAPTFAYVADELAAARDLGVQIIVVEDGGNVFRGSSAPESPVDQADADNVGMLGTIISGILLCTMLDQYESPDIRLTTAMQFPSIAEPFIRLRVLDHLKQGRVVLLAHGLGQPYVVTTDCPDIRRGAQINANSIMLAKDGIDGIYGRDPRADAAARKYDAGLPGRVRPGRACDGPVVDLARTKPGEFAACVPVGGEGIDRRDLRWRGSANVHIADDERVARTQPFERIRLSSHRSDSGAQVTDERYAALCDYAVRTARALVTAAGGTPHTRLARYVLEQSESLLAARNDEGRVRPPGAATEALDLVVATWPDFLAGTRTGEEAFAAHEGLWHRLMASWPMGSYAELVVGAYRQHDPVSGLTVELGSGAGITTRPLSRAVIARGGRLLASDKVYAGPRSVDFDRPLVGQLPDSPAAVVATNALHCAADPVTTIRWIRRCLQPGGLLVLGEGAPFPESGVPWALNLVFGICAGWYDCGGFRPPPYWSGALQAAGFVDLAVTTYPSDRYDFGGVFVGTAP